MPKLFLQKNYLGLSNFCFHRPYPSFGWKRIYCSWLINSSTNMQRASKGRATFTIICQNWRHRDNAWAPRFANSLGITDFSQWAIGISKTVNIIADRIYLEWSMLGSRLLFFAILAFCWFGSVKGTFKARVLFGKYKVGLVRFLSVERLLAHQKVVDSQGVTSRVLEVVLEGT